jgi:hypothetical protein
MQFALLLYEDDAERVHKTDAETAVTRARRCPTALRGRVWVRAIWPG